VKTLFPHQVSCSIILAAALRDLFPAALVRSFQATEKYFYCDVIFPFTFESEMIPLLEERMKGWVKKDLPFKQLEMMPANAAQFLKHQGNPQAAEVVRHASGTVEIIQLDRFAGLSPGKSLESTGEVKFYKLVPPQLHGNWMRLIGTSALSKDDLKLQVKECKELPDHLSLVQEMKLLAPCQGGWLWLPKGEALKKIYSKKLFNFFLKSTPSQHPLLMIKT
jgi:threonyl-tRNA synthetase